MAFVQQKPDPIFASSQAVAFSAKIIFCANLGKACAVVGVINRETKQASSL